MIRGGRLVHQGPVADLAAGQRPDIVLAPEHPADLTHLASVLESAGLSVRVAEEDGTAVVKAPGATAADLNRLAAAEGITLRQIAERTHSLEDLFFRLTGTGAAMSRGQEMGAIR
jgi:ABC-type multidrug transport system ATPase subunit